MTWSLKGTYFESCNCDAACPCVFLSAPTDGECTVLVGWHIEEGHDDGVSLDGLNVALAVHSPSHMLETQWKAAAYVDCRATEDQRNALLRIFGGQAGGHPARFAGHIGELVGATPADMDFTVDGGKYRLKIAEVADVAIEQMAGQGDGPITISGHPLCISPGYPATLAKSTSLVYRDHGMSWELSGKNGFFAPFAYAN